MKNGTIVWYMLGYHITPFHHVRCFGRNRIYHHYGEEHSLLNILANSVSHKTLTVLEKSFPKSICLSIYVELTVLSLSTQQYHRIVYHICLADLEPVYSICVWCIVHVALERTLVSCLGHGL